ncbi:hypothetical protein [Sphingomonas sp.]|uniref:hypothetical protein n=2 Tax=Sphingomonas sp. TaxID=28214 RepID=UPI003F70759D
MHQRKPELEEKMKRVSAGLSIYALIAVGSIIAIALLAIAANRLGFPRSADGVTDSIIIELGSFIVTVALIGSLSAWVQNRIEEKKLSALRVYASSRLGHELSDVIEAMQALKQLAVPEPATLRGDFVKIDGVRLFYRPLAISRFRLALRELEQRIVELRALIAEIGFVVPVESRDHLFGIGRAFAALPRHANWIADSHADHYLEHGVLPEAAPKLPDWTILQGHIEEALRALGMPLVETVDVAKLELLIERFSTDVAHAYLRTDESLIDVSDRYDGILPRSERYELAIRNGYLPDILKRAP